MNLRNKKNSHSRGQAIIEFIFFIPFLIIFIFAAVEYGNMFMAALRVSSLSREAAGAAHHDCTGLTGPSLDTCLNDIVTKVSTLAADVLPNFGSRGYIIISVYDDPIIDTSQAGNTTNTARLLSIQSSGGTSHYNSSKISTTIINALGVIAIGEVSYNYVTVTPIQNLLNTLGIPAQIYEVTIY